MTNQIETPPGILEEETTELLRGLIRNRCVNSGHPDSGGEVANAGLLADYLSGSGLELELVEPHPSRASLIANLPGAGGSEGGLVLLGHTDVVDANPDHWTVPPFAGELIDGVVWGRGAVDMLGMTASMAVALRHLGLSGFRPAADLTLLAVADEEAGGGLGAGWLAANRPELFRSRSVVTESGGFPLHGADGVKLECFVGEKGALGAVIRVTGRSGHGAFPYRTDNPLFLLPEVLERLRGHDPAPAVDDVWLRYLSGLGLPERVRTALSHEHTFDAALDQVPIGLARHFHAVTRTTVAPTVLRAGGKRNIIPDSVEIELDVRVLPGQSQKEVESGITDLFSGLPHVAVHFANWRAGTRSAMDVPLWAALEDVCAELVPGAEIVPAISSATTDGRHVRPFGSPCYGFGLFTDRIPAEEYFRMFHGADERVDQGSLVSLCRLWQSLAQRMPPPAKEAGS